MIFRLKRYLPFLLATLLFSCEKSGVETRVVSLSSFNTIELNDVFHVYLLQDTIYSIRIEAAESAAENIFLKVENNTLSISNESKRKWMSPENNRVNLYITSDQLAQIIVNQTCYIETLNPIMADSFGLIMGSSPKLAEANLELNCKNFSYWNNHQCGGKLTLTGRAESINVSTFALMSVDAANLVTDFALIENNSKGDCEIFVSNKLEYSIRGTGNIYLHGQPPEIILNEKTSTGELILVR